MRIGTLEVACPVFLAPMAGVTDAPQRILAKEFGCGLVYSEMISDKGVNYRNCHTLEMLRSEPAERPLALQLFGAEPESVAEAARYVESLGVADVIDFNMGCPAPKVVKNGEGSALMRDPLLAERILRALRRAVRLPVTVKMRKGWDAQSVNVVELARRAEDAGVDAVAVHGRTRADFYAGRADWDCIAEVKRSLQIPVIGNGDVRSAADAARMLRETGCDAVMIGRAAQGNPWIFREAAQYLRTGELPAPPALAERRAVLLRHLDLLLAAKGDYIGAREMRKHAAWYTRGLPHAAQLRAAFNRAETRADFAAILERQLGDL